MPYDSFKFFLETGKYKLALYAFEGYPMISLWNATVYLEVFENYKNSGQSGKE